MVAKRRTLAQHDALKKKPAAGKGGPKKTPVKTVARANKALKKLGLPKSPNMGERPSGADLGKLPHDAPVKPKDDRQMELGEQVVENTKLERLLDELAEVKEDLKPDEEVRRLRQRQGEIMGEIAVQLPQDEYAGKVLRVGRWRLNPTATEATPVEFVRKPKYIIGIKDATVEVKTSKGQRSDKEDRAPMSMSGGAGN